METFLIGFFSAAIPVFMYYTLGGRNTLYIFGAICIFGILVAVFEDKNFSSSSSKGADFSSSSLRYFVCTYTDGKLYTIPKVATLVVDEANKKIVFKSFEENKIYADLQYSVDYTNEPEIFAYSQSKSITFNRYNLKMRISTRDKRDNRMFSYYQCEDTT